MQIFTDCCNASLRNPEALARWSRDEAVKNAARDATANSGPEINEDRVRVRRRPA
jgi:hypothetical protein